ncbi:hypothetical protein BKA56DRAFT_613368 [Ilyonectria sp. MPI-CAGE-AT-0026]|nr:hypothetical protein BKA56DRAFT_613368 [Ilyonectria sp. MPI-CAGE-AT-0026]
MFTGAFTGPQGSLGLFSCCRQDRKAARVPPGRHWRVAAGSHWTAPGADVHKPRPPAVPRIGGPPPPARQGPQASTAANPLDGVQATAKTSSFTGGSRLVQRLGLLDWLATQRRIPEAPVGLSACSSASGLARSLSSSQGPRAASRLETLLPTARHGLASALAWADVLDLAACVFSILF